jgi:hypothetical protein
MKVSLALIFALLAAVSFAQIVPAPGTPPDAQAAQAYAFAQSQAMMMTNQAQLQGMIATQASLLNSVEAQSMFLGMAASLQAQMENQQNVASQAASINAMQQSLNMQNDLRVQSAIRNMRSMGIENAAAMQHAVQLASLDAATTFGRRNMLHALAAQSSGQTTSDPSEAKPAAAEAAPLPVEPPPMMIRPTFGDPLDVERPIFTPASGTGPAAYTVSIRSATHYATIYYTTNGWTPTTQSAKYTGPIPIHSKVHLEAIAVGPNFIRSAVERADYEVRNAPVPVLESTVAVPEDGTLRAGTPVRVAFAADVDSETAAVGDPVKLVLDEQVKLGDTVVAPKGTPVHAALTFADPARSGVPGDLVFEIHSVEIAGKHVPLFGGETLEGIKGGKNATIKAGMTAMAFVAADTAVK